MIGKMNVKSHENIGSACGILHAVVSEILNYIGALLIMESVCIINLIQVIEQKQFQNEIETYLALFDGHKFFLNLSALAMVATIFIIIIRWIFKKTNYFALRFFTILMCYAIALFYGRNSTNSYGSMNTDVVACVLLGLYILRVVLECLYDMDWGKIRALGENQDMSFRRKK